MKRTQILINKPMYLGLSILKINEIVIYEFWYDHAKLEHGRKKRNYVTCIEIAL